MEKRPRQTALAAAILVSIFTSSLWALEPNDAADTSLVVDGEPRQYLIHIPTDLPPSPVPVVIVLHGANGSGANFEKETGFSELADAHHFIAVYPEIYTTTPPNSDASRRGWLGALNHPSLDVDFLGALISSLISTRNVDPKRVFLVGHSSGALLAYRAAIVLSDKVTAVATCCGDVIWADPGKALPGLTTLPVPDPMTPPPLLRPISLIAFNSQQDKAVPFNGRLPFGWPIPTTIQWWTQQDECPAVPSVQSLENGTIQVNSYSGANQTKVVQYVFSNGSHGWKCGIPDFHMTDIIWDFFSSLSSHSDAGGAP